MSNSHTSLSDGRDALPAAGVRACLAALAMMFALVPAAPAKPLTLGRGIEPSMAVDANGTAYVAWLAGVSGWDGRPPVDARLLVCKLPAAASRCVRIGDFPLDDDVSVQWDSPHVFVGPGPTVDVAAAEYGPGVNSGEFRFRSTDGGTHWMPRVPVGPLPLDGAFGDPVTGLEVGIGDASPGSVLEAYGESGMSAVLDQSQDASGFVGAASSGTLVAAWRHDPETVRVATFTADAPGPAQIDDPLAWTVSDLAPVHGTPWLTAGPAGVFLFLSGNMRRVDANTVGPSLPMTCGEQVGDDSSVTEEPDGHIDIAYATASGIRYVRVVGARHSTPLTLFATREWTRNLTAGDGLVVWQYRQSDDRDATVMAARLPRPAVPLQGCRPDGREQPTREHVLQTRISGRLVQAIYPVDCLAKAGTAKLILGAEHGGGTPITATVRFDHGRAMRLRPIGPTHTTFFSHLAPGRHSLHLVLTGTRRTPSATRQLNGPLEVC